MATNLPIVLPFAEPAPAGSHRARQAKAMRELATEVSRLHPQALTRSNGEERDHGEPYPANFTKGLAHDEHGVVQNPADYRNFVEAINSDDRTLFEKHVETGESCLGGRSWRGWESPRAGHVYELQGPDAGAVGMAPAPRVGSDELAAEIAEVYALAILRDVPFVTIAQGEGDRLCQCSAKDAKAELTAKQVLDALNSMPFYNGHREGKNRKNVAICSSTSGHTDPHGYSRFERYRRDARGDTSKACHLFRGSTEGARKGPYISQFLLAGSPSLATNSYADDPSPREKTDFGPLSGLVRYGALTVDQRVIPHKACLDHMISWSDWLDVQNGLDIGGTDQFESRRRFITTPRDLATYVHYDALYEAYLNACLILLALKTPKSKGFPEPSPSRKRAAFATFGDPHVLSLVTEVATRCLKAVRRQKFCYHRRARPEVIAARLALIAVNPKKAKDVLQGAFSAFERTLSELPQDICNAIIAHNAQQNGGGSTTKPSWAASIKAFDTGNLLLPMAFPEGSPMHPSYGAGHATVAGGCVTVLKAFFEMFEDRNGTAERTLNLEPNSTRNPICGYEPIPDFANHTSSLQPISTPLTIQGELDKLAANISIGRNMAGVHYYSDYYDSLRMGERVAVGILLEQAPTYGEAVECAFRSFDGDLVTISGAPYSCPSLSILDKQGVPVSPRDWWLRHVSGEEFSEDL